MKTVCDRCGMDIKERVGKIYERLFEYTFENEFGEEVKMSLCWDCDFDVMNGGDPFRDSWEIWEEREDEESGFDY